MVAFFRAALFPTPPSCFSEQCPEGCLEPSGALALTSTSSTPSRCRAASRSASAGTPAPTSTTSSGRVRIFGGPRASRSPLEVGEGGLIFSAPKNPSLLSARSLWGPSSDSPEQGLKVDTNTTFPPKDVKNGVLSGTGLFFGGPRSPPRRVEGGWAYVYSALGDPPGYHMADVKAVRSNSLRAFCLLNYFVFFV